MDRVMHSLICFQHITYDDNILCIQFLIHLGTD